ncbi:hypothetical protein [Variovorax sp. GT1P44]|uniref:hypothetical protein n=1 Tax=Variovorax sp. GT1P44 TaxID=3443742 RepID=UPI003F47BEA8
MTRLVVCGDNGGPVRWDGLVYVRVDSRAIACAEVARIGDGGQRLHVEHFRPIGISAEHAIAVRRLTLLEIITHALAQEPAFAAITVSLHYRAPGEEEGIAEAAARASFLRSFGASEIRVTPDVAQTKAGQFVVSALWERNPTAVQMLEGCLAAERVGYDRFAASPSLKQRIERWLRPAAQRRDTHAL